MKIVFIVDKSNFLIPTWLDQVISKLTSDKIIATTPLPVQGKINWRNNLLTNLHYLSLPKTILSLSSRAESGMQFVKSQEEY